jgi:AP2-associated kinase
MAFQQANNKGTLVTGQTISVNKYTVQVEKYLSQGSALHSSIYQPL